MELQIASEAAMEALGGRLAGAITTGCSIYLKGPLGAGKTTMVRGLLRGMGYTENVRSPTYALVESYQLGGYEIYHFDLYRLAHTEELENIGIRDYMSPHSISIIEWPERAAEVLPPADITFDIQYDGTARKVFIHPGSPVGCSLSEILN